MHGLAWLGMAWHGLAWLGLVWLGMARLFVAKHCLGADERLFRRARGIDFRPVDAAEIELLLFARNDCVGV